MLAMLVEVVPQGGPLRNLAASSSPMRGFLQVQTQGSWRYGQLVPGSLVTLGKLLTLSWPHSAHLGDSGVQESGRPFSWDTLRLSPQGSSAAEPGWHRSRAGGRQASSLGAQASRPNYPLLPKNCWVLRAGKKPRDHLIRPLIVQTSRLTLGKGRELRRPTTKPRQMEGWTPAACLFFCFHFCPPSAAGGSFSLKPLLPSEMAAGKRDPRASGWASGISVHPSGPRVTSGRESQKHHGDTNPVYHDF